MGENTELPWEAETDLPYGRHPRIHSADGRLIAEVGNSEIERQDEWEANAALIVKAVNAHEAMKEALENAVSLIDEDIIRVRPSDRKQLLAALAEWNAALSLAEGVE